MRLSDSDRAALEFLTQGPDEPGIVDSHEVLAAHLVFLGLVEQGLASKVQGDDGPIYSITAAGRAALVEPTRH